MKALCVLILFCAITPMTWAGEVTARSGTTDGPAKEPKNTTSPVILQERTEYYEVCGCCEHDLQCELSKKCIRRSDGKKYDSITNWKLSWDYRRNRTASACAAEAFVVTVNITFHLPKWAPPGEAPKALVEKWDAYEKSLLLHEKQHEEIAVEAANDLTRSISELPPARTCDELDRKVRRLVDERSRRLIEDQKAYDAATNHGVTQGAVFP